MSEPSYSILVYPASELPEQYQSMIFSQWLRSLRFGNPFFKNIIALDFFRNYHAFLDNLMKKPSSQIRLAVLTDDHDICLGFCVSREDVLDYIHVQRDNRRIGIGTKLLPEGITAFTHITVVGKDIWQKKYKRWKFNPFA